jgi:hypothetical protein
MPDDAHNVRFTVSITRAVDEREELGCMRASEAREWLRLLAAEQEAAEQAATDRAVIDAMAKARGFEGAHRPGDAEETEE